MTTIDCAARPAMRPIRRLFPALLAGVIAVPLAAQEIAVFAGLRYEVPARTRVVQRIEQRVLHAEQVGADFCVYGATVAFKFDGTAEEAFRREWTTYAKERGAIDALPPEPRTTATYDGWTHVFGTKRERLATGQTVVATHTALWSPGRVVNVYSYHSIDGCTPRVERFHASARAEPPASPVADATAGAQPAASGSARAPATTPQPARAASGGRGTVDLPPATVPGAPPHALVADTVRRGPGATMPTTLAGTWEFNYEPQSSFQVLATGTYMNLLASSQWHLQRVRRFRLGADGHYSFEYEVFDGNKKTISRRIETGRYTPDGAFLRFVPAALWNGTGRLGQVVRVTSAATPPAWAAEYTLGRRPGCCSSEALHLFLPGNDVWENFRPVAR